MNKRSIFLLGFFLVLIALFSTNLWLELQKPKNQTNTVKTKVLSRSVTVQNHPATFSTKILFIGDIMLARTIGQGILTGENPFTFVQKTIDSYSFNIANVETTIADPALSQQARGKLFTFNAPLATIETLKQAKIDVAVLANNHTRDYGPTATANMIDNLEKAGIKIAGAGKNIDLAFTPLITDIPVAAEVSSDHQQSVRLAIIAVNKIENSFTNATANLAGSAFFDKNRILTEIKSARENSKADIVVVFPHWGVEYQTLPNSDQVNWGHFFIDNGADIVIGSHPHVVQPTEIYKGKSIVYSLGNFIFDGMGGNALDGQMIGLEIKLKSTVTDLGTLVEGTKNVVLGEPKSILIHIDSRGFPEIK